MVLQARLPWFAYIDSKFLQAIMNLYSRILGEGPALIVLHGLLGSLNNWQALAARFAADHRVFLLDQRNHGRSPHDPLHSYPALAADLVSYMDNGGLDRASVLGHSMGGKAAMYAALHYPGRIDRLIVVDIAPRAYPPGHDLLLEALNSLDLQHCQTREDADRLLSASIPDNSVRQFLLTNLKRDEQGRLAWRMNLRTLTREYPRMLEPVSAESPFPGEALFVRGGLSPYVASGDELQILRLFPRARIRTIAGAGHWVHAERPEEFLAAAAEFLAT